MSLHEYNTDIHRTAYRRRADLINQCGEGTRYNWGLVPGISISVLSTDVTAQRERANAECLCVEDWLKRLQRAGSQIVSLLLFAKASEWETVVFASSLFVLDPCRSNTLSPLCSVGVVWF